MERKSELKVLSAYILIIGAYLLGIDVQQIVLLLTDAEQYTKDIRELVTQANGKGGAAVSAGVATMLYGACRTFIKRNIKG